MTWVIDLADGPTELDQVWGRRQEFFEVFVKDYLRSIRRVGDPELVELARLRIAELVESEFDSSLRYLPAVQAGLGEDKILAIPDYPTSDLFNQRERVVLEFTEQLVIQVSSISDEDCERLQAHVTSDEFINLVRALSTMDQFARTNSTFRIQATSTVPPLLAEDFSISPTFAP